MADATPAASRTAKRGGMDKRAKIIAAVGAVVVAAYVYYRNRSSSSTATTTATGTTATVPEPTTGNTIYNIGGGGASGPRPSRANGLLQRPNLFDYQELTERQAQAVDSAGGHVLFLSKRGYLSPWRGPGTAPGHSLWVSKAWWSTHHPQASHTEVSPPPAAKANAAATTSSGQASSGSTSKTTTRRTTRHPTGGGTTKRTTHRGTVHAGKPTGPPDTVTTGKDAHSARPATTMKVAHRSAGRRHVLAHGRR